MKSYTEKPDSGQLQYKRAELSPVAKVEVNTKSRHPTGRTVVTTKIDGSIVLRYAPKQPR